LHFKYLTRFQAKAQLVDEKATTKEMKKETKEITRAARKTKLENEDIAMDVSRLEYVTPFSLLINHSGKSKN
jgi:hypothetical protein